MSLFRKRRPQEDEEFVTDSTPEPDYRGEILAAARGEQPEASLDPAQLQVPVKVGHQDRYPSHTQHEELDKPAVTYQRIPTAVPPEGDPNALVEDLNNQDIDVSGITEQQRYAIIQEYNNQIFSNDALLPPGFRNLTLQEFVGLVLKYLAYKFPGDAIAQVSLGRPEVMDGLFRPQISSYGSSLAYMGHASKNSGYIQVLAGVSDKRPPDALHPEVEIDKQPPSTYVQRYLRGTDGLWHYLTEANDRSEYFDKGGRWDGKTIIYKRIDRLKNEDVTEEQPVTEEEVQEYERIHGIVKPEYR